ncbi:MAG: phosphopantothenoylcysteine decarboxylase, partial [Pseudomonadota bacterium]
AALARALLSLGAEVTFVTGPADVPPPSGMAVIKVETARQMLDAVEAALPADAAVFAAAVGDWHVDGAHKSKIKKSPDGAPPAIVLRENPDVLASIAQRDEGRPSLVVGFAAETNDVIANATAKRLRKGCDWILANDVSPETGIMGGAENAVTLISEQGAESWPRMQKQAVANKLAERIAQALAI